MRRSAAAAEALTFPIDFAKTRMQLKVGRHTSAILIFKFDGSILHFTTL